MRILVLIHEYPPVGGGGGRVAQDLCQGLANRGHTLEVLSAQCGDLPRESEQGGVRVIRLPSGRRELFRADMRAMVGYVGSAVWSGLRVVRSFRPDVIHAHFAVPAGAAAWLLSRLTGVPYVLTAHLGDVPGGTPEKTGKWFRWIFPFTPPIWKGACQVAAVSQFTRSLALANYPVGVQVIPNGVDLRQYDPGKIVMNTPPQVVFAGRFMAQKNPLQIVRSLAEVRDLPWKAMMLGDGPLRPAVEAEISRLGLTERIGLTGWLEPAQVLEFFRRSDLLFMPSLSEGLPVVGVQGMAYGLALVLSAAGGNPELVVEGENGFLVEPSNAPGFAAALRSLLSDPERLLSARLASRRLAARFDLNTVLDAYEQVLTRAVDLSK
jgi:L-malate glycosyltransferase